MTITKDATKGWALPASAAEWTELLAGQGISNPDSAWRFNMGSGNASDLIGSLTLSAKGTPQYGVAATGWSATGIDATDNTTDGFVAGSGVGSSPATTSQTWMFVVSIEVEPTATRTFLGISVGASGLAANFQPTAGTNKIRAICVGSSTDGAADHSVGSYVLTLRYDRAASVAKVYTDLETITATYSASATDGNKGFGVGGTTAGSITVLYAAMWSGSNAESLDDTKIGTIRSLIENPPSGVVIEDEYNYQYQRAAYPRSVIPPRQAYHQRGDELPITPASIALDDAPATRRALPRSLAVAATLARTHLAYAADDLPPQPVVVGPTAPGPTLTALQAGSTGGLKWVAAIEGYRWLLTDADTEAVTTAWEDTGYSAAMGGLLVRHSPQQEIDPWNPFANTGGSLTLQMQTDQFGIDTHITSGGSETFATASIDCDDTTLNVGASFVANTIYVGTEAIGVGGTTSTSFTGLERGLYSPFKTESGGNFAHPHEITEDPTAIAVPPLATSSPRTWEGRWVNLSRHLYSEATGLLNAKDDALCVGAYRCDEVRDNPQTGTTDLECTHILQYINEAVLGENPWKATIEDGISLKIASNGTPQRFQISDWTDSNNVPAINTATPLTVVPGTPASVYEIQEGRYSMHQVKSAINAWLHQAKTDGDIEGLYRLSFTTGPDGLTHGRLSYRMTTAVAGTHDGRFKLTMPWTFSRAFGMLAGSAGAEFFDQVVTRDIIESDHWFHELSVNGALRSVGESQTLETQFGDFFDQSASAPAGLLSLIPTDAVGAGEVGICFLNDASPVIITKNGDSLVSCTGFNPRNGLVVENALDIPWDQPGESTLRQVIIVQDTWANLIKRIFLSSGTTGHNHTDWDTFPSALALGIPYEACGQSFIDSIDALPFSDVPATVVLAKPTKLADLLGGGLLLRFAFLRWISGGLRFCTWQTPTTGAILEESNKASPVDNTDEQRSSTLRSQRWARNVIKIDYDRVFTIGESGSDEYIGHKTIIDRASISGSGGQRTVQTITDPTSYSDSFLGGGGNIDPLIDYFKSTVRMFTRAIRTSKRTIAPTFFEGYSVGDSILVNDNYARDPDTGARGVATRPGILVSHAYEPGGFTTGDGTDDMHGEVEVMFLDLLRVGPYVPCANVSSYNAGTKTLTCEANGNSASGDTADASYMSAGRKVRILERDPANPASPLSWDDTVASQTGNTITLTTGLAGYDAAKFYRVIWDDYADALAAQQVFSYQADDADHRIVDTRSAYQYTANTIITFPGDSPANSASDAVELPPDASYGDGVGLDVGHQIALNRLINNLYDYKTALNAPIMFQSAMSVNDVGDAWKLVLAMPVFLSADGLTNATNRKLYVAPMIKSNSGVEVKARVTLSKSLPVGESLLDVYVPTPYASVEFSTTSTTYVTPTTQAISYRGIKDFTGVAYLLIELQAGSGITTASCRGISVSYEGPRE